jgi:hypothetical protein
MPGLPDEAHSAANYGAQDAIGAGAGAGAEGLAGPLDNFIKWSATQNLGGERTAKVKELIEKAKTVIERKAKDIYQDALHGLLGHRDDGFDHGAVIDALDLDKKIDSPENIEAVKNAINSQDKGKEYSPEETGTLLKSLKGTTTEKFNEFFEELAQEYYKNSLVDPLSKVNQFVDAFAAAIGGPQSLLGHALGAWYRNAKANTLGDIAKKLVDDLESRYKDNDSEVGGEDSRLKFSAGQKRGPDDGGSDGVGLASSKKARVAGDGVGLASSQKARAGVGDGAVLAAADAGIHHQPKTYRVAAAAGLLDGVIGRDADGVFDASSSVV